MVIFHSYVAVYQRVSIFLVSSLNPQPWNGNKMGIQEARAYHSNPKQVKNLGEEPRNMSHITKNQ